MRKNSHWKLALAASGVVFATGELTRATIRTWANVGSDFNVGANWGGTAPSTGDTAFFTGALTVSPDLFTSGDSINNISVDTAGFTLSSTSGGALTLTSNNLNTSAAFTASYATGTVTISAPLMLAPSSGGTSTFYFSNAAGGGGLTVTGPISESAGGTILSLATSLNGTFTLSGDNKFSGGTNVGKGASLNINSATAIGTGALSIVSGTPGTIDNTSGNAITLANTNNINLSGNLNFGGTYDLNFGSNVTKLVGTNRNISVTAGTLTIGSLAEDTAGSSLTKNGNGTLAILNAAVTGTNAYTGNTVLSTGSVILGNDTALGTGSIAMNGVTISGSTAVSLANNFTLGGTNTFTGTNSLTFGGNLASTTTKTFLNSITGPAGLTFSGSLNIGSNSSTSATLTFDGTGSTTISGALLNNTTSTGTSAISQIGAGTLTLTNSGNTYNGVTTVAAGTLAIGGSGVLGASTAGVVVSGGTLDLGGTSQTKAAVSITGSAAILTGTLTGSSFAINNSSGTATISSNLVGSGATLTKSNAGTLILSGSNSYTGLTTVSGGTAQLNNALALPTGGNVALTSSTAVLDINGYSINNPFTNITNGATLTNSGGAATVSGLLTIASSALVTIGGAGDLTLSNTITGGNNAGTLIKNGVDTFTIGGSAANTKIKLEVSSGNAILGKTGGVNALSAVNTADAALILDSGAGTVSYAAGGAQDQIGDSFGISINGGTFDMSGASESIRGLGGSGGTITNSALSTTSTLTIVGNTTTYAGTIADGTGGTPGKIAISLTSGTQGLSGANSYSGGTTANGGTLLLGSDSAFGTGTLNFTGATVVASADATAHTISNTFGTVATNLTFGQASGGTGNLLINSTSPINWKGGVSTYTLSVAGSTSVTISSVIGVDTSSSTTFSLTKTGSGTLVLAGANTFVTVGGSPGFFVGGNSATPTNASSGTVQLVGSGTLGATTNNIGIAAGTLDLTSTTQTIGSLTLGAGASLSTATLMMSTGGVLNTGGNVARSAAGNADTSLITGGTLNLNSANRSFSISDSLGTATDLVVNSVIANGSNPTAGLTKTGAGVLVFGGANSYTGATTVSAGMLATASAGGNLGTGNVNVLAAATLNLGNNQSISDVGTLTLAGTGTTATGFIVLAFSSGEEDVGTLVLGGNSFSTYTVFNQADNYNGYSSYFAGSNAGASLVVAAPEPTSLSLIGLGAIGMLRRRRRGTV